MNNLKNVPEFLKYFRLISPSEININKDDIFYRDKYNDIINYIKVMLTNNDNMLIQEYLKPKGILLINVNSGTDIVDFLKLISSNYYLDFIELNYNEIIESPNKFMKCFDSIIRSFNITLKSGGELETFRPEKKGTDQANLEKNDNKKLLIINQQKKTMQALQGISLLQNLINNYQNNSSNLDFINSNYLLIWINYDLKEIAENSNQIYNIFDLFIKIPLLNEFERETILRHFLEKNPKIVFDINTIVKYTVNWEVKDINHLLKVGIFKHFLNSELNETSNEITDILIDLIESGEYLPSINAKVSEIPKDNGFPEENAPNFTMMQNWKENEKFKTTDISEIINSIRQSNASEFMLNQLYENAASKNYKELILIIDKLNKNESLEDNDRKLLAKYPFVLNDSPNKAQINLEKARKRVDQINQAFGK
ncbi:MAG: hypothetical protein ACFFA6_02055 [Promethearchaeota archaeon]